MNVLFLFRYVLPDEQREFLYKFLKLFSRKYYNELLFVIILNNVNEVAAREANGLGFGHSSSKVQQTFIFRNVSVNYKKMSK